MNPEVIDDEHLHLPQLSLGHLSFKSSTGAPRRQVPQALPTPPHGSHRTQKAGTKLKEPKKMHWRKQRSTEDRHIQIRAFSNVDFQAGICMKKAGCGGQIPPYCGEIWRCY